MTDKLVTKPAWRFPTLKWPSLFEDEEWLMPGLWQNGLTVAEDDKQVYVEAALPGVDQKDIKVTFDKGILSIQGETKEEKKKEEEKRKYYRKATTSFAYRTLIPGTVKEGAEPQAVYTNGIIKIVFTKVPEPQPKEIKVQSS